MSKNDAPVDENDDDEPLSTLFVCVFFVVSSVTLVVLGVCIKEMRDNMNELGLKVNELQEALVR